jgi:hypothetical protein
MTLRVIGDNDGSAPDTPAEEQTPLVEKSRLVGFDDGTGNTMTLMGCRPFKDVPFMFQVKSMMSPDGAIITPDDDELLMVVLAAPAVQWQAIIVEKPDSYEEPEVAGE